MGIIATTKVRPTAKLFIAGAIALGAGTIAFLAPVFGVGTPSLLPIGNGTYQQWLSRGGNNFNTVDEPVCNGTSDFVYTKTVGNRESFLIDTSSIPPGSIIDGVTVSPCAGGNSSTTMNLFYTFDGINGSDAGNYRLTGGIPVVLPNTVFNNLSFIQTGSSSLQVGAVLSAATPDSGIALSQLGVTVSYTPVPMSPTLLSSRLIGIGPDVELSWTDNAANEDGFAIYRDGVQISSVGTNVTSYRDPAPAAGTYAYQVRAYNSYGNSAQFSNTVSVTIVPPPPVSTNCNATVTVAQLFPGQFSNTKFSVTVDDADGMSSFQVTSAQNGNVLSGSPACLTSVRSGTLTLDPANFPLSAVVTDCANPANYCTLTVSAP